MELKRIVTSIESLQNAENKKIQVGWLKWMNSEEELPIREGITIINSRKPLLCSYKAYVICVKEYPLDDEDSTDIEDVEGEIISSPVREKTYRSGVVSIIPESPDISDDSNDSIILNSQPAKTFMRATASKQPGDILSKSDDSSIDSNNTTLREIEEKSIESDDVNNILCEPILNFKQHSQNKLKSKYENNKIETVKDNIHELETEADYEIPKIIRTKLRHSPQKEKKNIHEMDTQLNYVKTNSTSNNKDSQMCNFEFDEFTEDVNIPDSQSLLTEAVKFHNEVTPVDKVQNKDDIYDQQTQIIFDDAHIMKSPFIKPSRSEIKKDQEICNFAFDEFTEGVDCQDSQSLLTQGIFQNNNTLSDLEQAPTDGVQDVDDKYNQLTQAMPDDAEVRKTPSIMPFGRGQSEYVDTYENSKELNETNESLRLQITGENDASDSKDGSKGDTWFDTFNVATQIIDINKIRDSSLQIDSPSNTPNANKEINRITKRRSSRMSINSPNDIHNALTQITHIDRSKTRRRVTHQDSPSDIFDIPTQIAPFDRAAKKCLSYCSTALGDCQDDPKKNINSENLETEPSHIQAKSDSSDPFLTQCSPNLPADDEATQIIDMDADVTKSTSGQSKSLMQNSNINSNLKASTSSITLKGGKSTLSVEDGEGITNNVDDMKGSTSKCNLEMLVISRKKIIEESSSIVVGPQPDFILPTTQVVSNKSFPLQSTKQKCIQNDSLTSGHDKQCSDISDPQTNLDETLIIDSGIDHSNKKNLSNVMGTSIDVFDTITQVIEIGRQSDEDLKKSNDLSKRSSEYVSNIFSSSTQNISLSPITKLNNPSKKLSLQDLQKETVLDVKLSEERYNDTQELVNDLTNSPKIILQRNILKDSNIDSFAFSTPAKVCRRGKKKVSTPANLSNESITSALKHLNASNLSIKSIHVNDINYYNNTQEVEEDLLSQTFPDKQAQCIPIMSVTPTVPDELSTKSNEAFEDKDENYYPCTQAIENDLLTQIPPSSEENICTSAQTSYPVFEQCSTDLLFNKLPNPVSKCSQLSDSCSVTSVKTPLKFTISDSDVDSPQIKKFVSSGVSNFEQNSNSDMDDESKKDSEEIDQPVVFRRAVPKRKKNNDSINKTSSPLQEAHTTKQTRTSNRLKRNVQRLIETDEVSTGVMSDLSSDSIERVKRKYSIIKKDSPKEENSKNQPILQSEKSKDKLDTSNKCDYKKENKKNCQDLEESNKDTSKSKRVLSKCGEKKIAKTSQTNSTTATKVEISKEVPSSSKSIKRNSRNNRKEKEDSDPNMGLKSANIELTKKPKLNENKSSNIDSMQRKRAGDDLDNGPETKKLHISIKYKSYDRCKVMCTQLTVTRFSDSITKLGGFLTNKDGDVLIAGAPYKRTLKVMLAAAKGTPIVSTRWLQASEKAKRFVDPWDYLIQCEELENKYKIKIEATLRHARPYLKGWVVFVTPQVLPSPDEIKEIIEASGGRTVIVSGLSGRRRGDTTLRGEIGTFTVTSEKDNHLWSSLPRPFATTEAIMMGALKHKVLVDMYRIKDV